MNGSSDDTPLAAVYGIGPQRADLFAHLGLHTQRDLLFYVPRRYEDRAHSVPLAMAAEGEAVTIQGRILQARQSRWRGGRTVFEVVLSPSGSSVIRPEDALHAMWFNVHYLQKLLVADREVVFHGKLKKGKKHWTMVHPEFEIVERDDEEYIHLSRITPIYGLTEGLSQRVLRRILYYATQKAPLDLPDPFPVPAELMGLPEAVREIHFPTSWEKQHQARQRLVYDEFFLQQCVLSRRRMSREKVRRERQAPSSALAAAFVQSLPFSPTGAQQRVMGELARDLALPTPMNRMLQGDVGSGKTMVAVYAMLCAVERGEHAALMAPTEILAEQHFLNLRRWLEPLGVSVGLHTGSKKKGDRSPWTARRCWRASSAARGRSPWAPTRCSTIPSPPTGWDSSSSTSSTNSASCSGFRWRRKGGTRTSWS